MSEFTAEDWQKIRRVFEDHAADYGLPERRDESVVIASFNIRKLGGLLDSRKNPTRTREAWRFLGDVCSRFDLIGIQEVLNNLGGIRFLRDLAGADEYGMAVSDSTGGVPGGQGMLERLCFLYRRKRVRRTEMASDISYDRSAVERNLLTNADEFATTFTKRAARLKKIERDYAAAVKAWEDGGKQGKKPKKEEAGDFPMPHFLSFVRTPYCASFEIGGLGDAPPYKILAVAAHLLYGEGTKAEQLQERENEFHGLIEWLMWRMANKETYYPNMILLGDLNLDFEAVDPRRAAIAAEIKAQDQALKGKSGSVYFPFLDAHPALASAAPPGTSEEALVFRTNAREDQTFDQIGFFGHDAWLPQPKHTPHAAETADGFNYGVFNFVDLFADALLGKPLAELSKAQQKAFYAKFEFDVSDHMPIWVRLPLPYPGQKSPLIE